MLYNLWMTSTSCSADKDAIPATFWVLIIRIVPWERLSTMAECRTVSASSYFSKHSLSNFHCALSKVVEFRVKNAGIVNVGRGRVTAGCKPPGDGGL